MERLVKKLGLMREYQGMILSGVGEQQRLDFISLAYIQFLEKNRDEQIWALINSKIKQNLEFFKADEDFKRFLMNEAERLSPENLDTEIREKLKQSFQSLMIELKHPVKQILQDSNYFYDS